MEKKYSIKINWSELDNGYIAIIPELSGCSSFGETYEKALENLKIAKQLYMEVLEEDNIVFPEAQHLQTYSGKIRLRMPKELHEKLSNLAAENDMSLNTYIVYKLGTSVGKDEVIDIVKSMFNKVQNKIILVSQDKPEIVDPIKQTKNYGLDQYPDLFQSGGGLCQLN